jgi:hypothetical protein
LEVVTLASLKTQPMKWTPRGRFAVVTTMPLVLALPVTPVLSTMQCTNLVRAAAVVIVTHVCAVNGRKRML